MDAILGRFVQAAWAQCWQVTLLIVLVSVLVALFGRTRPHLASVLWLLVIVKCLMPPVWSSPSGIFCWLQPTTIETVVPKSKSQPHSPELRRATAGSDPDAVVVQVSPNDATAARLVPMEAVNESRPLRTSTFPTQRVLALSLLIGWLGGLGSYSLLMALRWRKCWQEIRTGEQPQVPELNERLVDLQERLGVRRKLQLLITSSAVGPAVVGFWRPIIVLPLAIVANKPPRELDLLLAHELVHIRRGDLWIAGLQLLVQCLWWFHPLVRWANQWLTRETERSCDEEVIGRLGCSSAAYARSLLSVLELKQQLHPVPTFPGVRPVDVTKQRLERIMKLGQGCHQRTPWWCWAVMVILALVTLPGAALLVRAKDPPAKPTPQAQLIAAIGDEIPASETTAEQSTATYEVLDLLAKLESEIVENTTEAAMYLESTLQAVLQTNHSEGKDPRFGWHNGQLVVRTTVAGHRIVAEQLELYRKSGFDQYVFEVRVLRGSADLLKAVKADWQVIQSKFDANGDPFEISMDGENELSESTVNRKAPVIGALFDEAQMRTFMTQAQGNKDNNIICAPKITTFNGQSVRIESLERRPFVVSNKVVTETARQPEIRVVDVGWKMRLRARGMDGGKIKVDLARAESALCKVDVRDFPDGFSVQIPQVAVTRLQTQVELLPDQTYAISGLESLEDPEKPTPLWLLVTVRTIKDETLPSDQKKRTKRDFTKRPLPLPEDKGLQPEKVTTLYNVADLATAIDAVHHQQSNYYEASGATVQVALKSDGTMRVEQPKVPELDSNSLMELITDTIEPDSWADVGGEGTIEFVPSKSSLLITQYERNHERIDEFLNELRRLQAVTVVLNLKEVWIPHAEWQKLAAAPDHMVMTATIDQVQGFDTLKSEQTAALLKHDVRKHAQVTKALVYNGQPVMVEAVAGTDGKLPEDRLHSLWLLPVVLGDRSGVRLSLAPQSKTAFAAPQTLDDAKTLVLDLDRTDWQMNQSKLVTPAPATTDDKEKEKPSYRRLLVVTSEIFTSEGRVAKRTKRSTSAEAVE